MNKREKNMIIIAGSVTASVIFIFVLIFIIVAGSDKEKQSQYTGTIPSESVPVSAVESTGYYGYDETTSYEEYSSTGYYEESTSYSFYSEPTTGETYTQSVTQPEPDSQVRLYAYEFLNDNEKQVYREICKAIENHEPELNVKQYSISTDSMDRMRDYFTIDQPGYFWINGTWGYNYSESTDIVSKVNLTYCYTESEVAYMKLQIDAVVDEICADITPYMSEYEILLHVYESLIELIDYDTPGIELYDSVEHEDDEPDDLRSIYGAFVNRKAVCAGYSKATQYILQKYGIESAYISSIDSEDHAWNLVNVDGDYYYVDTTWGDGSNTDPEESYPDRIDYSFLCMTTEELASIDSHTPEGIIELPVCTSEKYNYYKNRGLYFEHADYDKLKSVMYDAFSQGEDTIVFRCDNAQVLSVMEGELMDEDYVWDCVESVCGQYGFTEPSRLTYYTDDDFHLMSISFIYE